MVEQSEAPEQGNSSVPDGLVAHNIGQSDQMMADQEESKELPLQGRHISRYSIADPNVLYPIFAAGTEPIFNFSVCVPIDNNEQNEQNF